jgi:hypothetical protein
MEDTTARVIAACKARLIVVSVDGDDEYVETAHQLSLSDRELRAAATGRYRRLRASTSGGD